MLSPPESGNPIGFSVVGADRAQGGVIKDLWVDRGESIMRYYEVDTGNDGKTVLLPVTFSVVDFKRRRVTVSALKGSQFSGVPTTRDSDKVTLLEEDKIAAYYGAGTLYAMPQRVEPLL